MLGHPRGVLQEIFLVQALIFYRYHLVSQEIKNSIQYLIRSYSEDLSLRSG